MKKYVNGKYIDLTPAELAEIESANRNAAIAESRRPLNESEVTRMIIAENINSLSVDDKTALRMKEFYPTFDELCKKAYKAEGIGVRFVYGDKLYKTRQPGYTFVSHYPPGVGTESLYEEIDDVHSGTIDDPKEYNGNMELHEGLYYMQYGEIYLCILDTQTAVTHPLRELVGLYVEIV